jgi:hypothetical protein
LRDHRRLLSWIAIPALCLLAACSGNDSEEASAHGVSNTLNWSATTETGVYGYLVYRSENRAGPFRRINTGIVRVPADGAETHAYTYEDGEVVPGRTYYYYLDAVAETGVKQRFSGVVSKTTPDGSDSTVEPG